MARTSRSLAANSSGLPVWPYSPPRKPSWPPGKTTGVTPRRSRCGDAPRPAAARLADSSPTPMTICVGAVAQRVEVGLVCRAGQHVLVQQWVVALAVVLGRQAEHCGSGAGRLR